MSRMDWVKDLVRAEQQLEASDMVDFSVGFDPAKTLQIETSAFMEKLKEILVDYSVAFNQMKGAGLGNVKIYGIANTEADFMLFRNGFKLIFSIKKPGQISIRFQHQGSFLMPGSTSEGAGATSQVEDLVEAQWGAFGEVFWTYQNLKLNPDNMVRYYLSHFIRESAK